MKKVPKKTTPSSFFLLFAILIAAGAGCTPQISPLPPQENSTMEETKNMKGEATTVGAYEDYEPSKLARASNENVILFFKASWCPTCRAVDQDITANLNTIPKGVNILKVNYDNSKELQKKYGVTYQHTFIQVDAQGNLIKKWSGGTTLASVLSQIQ